MWNDLLTACCLVLVLEGILPFIDPGRVRQLMMMAAQQNDRALRLAGLISMLVGATLLYLVN